MTGIRRTLALLGLTLGVVLGSAGATAPAQASFGDTASVRMATLATPTVAAPGNVTGALTCTNRSATMSATWSLSTSARVSGYLVTVYFSDGYSQTAQKSATDTSWSAPVNDLYYVTANYVRYTVTTQTDYGWTKESASTGWFKC